MTEFRSRRVANLRMLKADSRSDDSDFDHTREHDGADVVELGRLLRAVVRRKWLILGCTLGFAVILYLFAMAQPKTYYSSATVLLDPREQQVVATQDQVVSDLKLNNAILESEVALLRSRELMNTVVTTVGLDRFSAIDPVLAEPGPLDGTIDWIKRVIGGSATKAGPGDSGTAPLVSPEEQRLNRIVTAINQGYSVRRLGESYVIEISAETVDPQLSQLVADTVARTYIQSQLDERQRVAENATKWLSEQVDTLRDDLSRAESAVEEYKRQQLDQAGASEEVLAQRLGEMNQQLTIARSEQATEQARLQRLEDLMAQQGALVAAETQSSPYLASLRERREALISEDGRLALSLGANHPDRRLIASELANLETAITQEVSNIADGYSNELEVLRKREASLKADVDVLEGQLSDIAAASLRLRQLEREAEAVRTSYEDVLGRLGETRAQIEIQRAEARMITQARIASAPASPRTKLLTTFGAALGLTIGLVAALLLELAGAGVKDASELARITGLPVLTTIPRVTMRKPQDVLQYLAGTRYSLLAERIRQLRTIVSVRAKVPARGGNSVLVLSSVPNEGKTTTALALANSFASVGRRTLLLDLDTRRSETANHVAAQQNDLSDWLAGRCALEDIITQAQDLGVFVVGTRITSKLLADQTDQTRVRELLDALKAQFEVIVIDMPPVLAVSDALRVASHVDQILYVVAFRKTPKKSILEGLTTLKNLDLRPSGVVMTMAEMDGEAYSYGKRYAY